MLVPGIFSRFLRCHVVGMGMLVCGFGANAQVPEIEFVLDPPAIIDALRAGDFAAIESLYVGYQNDYQAGRISEVDLQRAYWVFTNSDPRLVRQLNVWIEAGRDSFVPWMARARHYHTVAWHRRTSQFTRNLSKPQIQEVWGLFSQAAEDYREAIKRRETLSIAYAGLVDIDMAVANVSIFRSMLGFYGLPWRKSAAEQTMRRGLAANPGSLVIRYNYLTSLLPWWNGTNGGNWQRDYDDIFEFVTEINDDLERYPHLEPLLGYADFAIGSMHSWENQDREALVAFDEAISWGDFGEFYSQRARSKHVLGDLDGALEDYDRALELGPMTARVLSARSSVLFDLGRVEAAAADLDAALEIDPYEPNNLLRRGYHYVRDGNIQAAEQPFERSGVHGAYYPDIRAARGEFYLTVLHDHEGALEDLRAATTMRLDEPKSWYYLARALMTLVPKHALEGQCVIVSAMEGEAIVALTQYEVLCRRNGNCDRENTDAARELQGAIQDSAPALCSAG